MNLNINLLNFLYREYTARIDDFAEYTGNYFGINDKIKLINSSPYEGGIIHRIIILKQESICLDMLYINIPNNNLDIQLEWEYDLIEAIDLSYSPKDRKLLEWVYEYADYNFIIKKINENENIY
jgi:hypothetical protein